ncbi:hypothetical protein HAX54_008918, partial [Datura stramonium]|nr:hypothetical protein [Datura stramonium]
HDKATQNDNRYGPLDSRSRQRRGGGPGTYSADNSMTENWSHVVSNFQVPKPTQIMSGPTENIQRSFQQGYSYHQEVEPILTQIQYAKICQMMEEKNVSHSANMT